MLEAPNKTPNTQSGSTMESVNTRDFTKNYAGSDVCFRFKRRPDDKDASATDRTLYANKSVLKMWSASFGDMFARGSETILCDDKFEDMQKLIEVLHPAVTLDNAHDILPLAQEYNIQPLTQVCEEVLLHTEPSLETLAPTPNEGADVSESLRQNEISGNENYRKQKKHSDRHVTHDTAQTEYVTNHKEPFKRVTIEAPEATKQQSNRRHDTAHTEYLTNRKEPVKRVTIEAPEHNNQPDDKKLRKFVDPALYRENGSVLLTEIWGNLFDAPRTYSLAHCVSKDFQMSKGIAKEFKRRFGDADYLWYRCEYVPGFAALQHEGRYIYYLETKVQFFNKPTYDSVKYSLWLMKNHCQRNGVTHVAMPMIGCGLDKLEWSYVKKMLIDMFDKTDVELSVYYM